MMLFPQSVVHVLPPNGRDKNWAGTSGIEYHLHLIKIPSHIYVESSYTLYQEYMKVTRGGGGGGGGGYRTGYQYSANW